MCQIGLPKPPGTKCLYCINIIQYPRIKAETNCANSFYPGPFCPKEKDWKSVEPH